MNLLQRIRNLWILSNFNIKKNSKGGVDVFVNKEDNIEILEKPKLAQIIKKKTPVKVFLEKNAQ